MIMGTSIVIVQVSQQIAPAPNLLQETGCFISQGGTNTQAGVISLLTQPSDLTPLLAGSAAISTIVWTGGTVVVTTTAPHGIPSGAVLLVTITGCVPLGFNGTWLCTQTGTSTFTYSLAVTPGIASTIGAYTLEDVSELLAMTTTFFAQGAYQAVYVMELGPGDAAEGVTALQAYIVATPQFFYSYLLPRAWSSEASYLTFLQAYESPSARTYFFTTMTTSNYVDFNNRMKDVIGMIEAPTVNGTFTISAITWASNVATVTTSTPHGLTNSMSIPPILIQGVEPQAYNGQFSVYITGLSTFTYTLTSNPGGSATSFGTGQFITQEFSLAAAFWVSLHYRPSTTNKVTPYSFAFLYGVTPFPTVGNAALLSTLKTANVNIIGTGAEGGITNTILLWGTTMDGRDFNYWYSVDWVAINVDLFVSNAIINGSNNPINPLYYNQDGINRLQKVIANVFNSGVLYGLVLFTAIEVGLDGPILDQALDLGTYDGNTIVNAVPFITYSQENPEDYAIGAYNGFSAIYVPARGFENILFNLVVSDFVAP
jgi:hypothetical protein